MSSLFLLHFSAHHPHPHSFPTRRSSDLMVNPEGPAHRAGLAHGEEIQAVDETPVAGKTYEQVVKMIRGEPGTTVKLTDRKSTRLNSSHLVISYAVFCLKKKKKCEQVTHK